MACQIDNASDGELVTLERHSTVTARKAHRCGECRAEIKIGESYEISKQLFEGEWTSFRSCLICVEIRDKLFCSWTWGGIWDDLVGESVFTLSMKDLSVPAIEKLERFWGEVNS
jgi:hypothetical protein